MKNWFQAFAIKFNLYGYIKAAESGGGDGLMYFYRLDFVSNFNEFTQLAQTAIVQSSIDNKLMLRFEARAVQV